MKKLNLLITLVFIISSSQNLFTQKEQEMRPPIDGTEETEELAA